jgi:hypothetical protein
MNIYKRTYQNIELINCITCSKNNKFMKKNFMSCIKCITLCHTGHTVGNQMGTNSSCQCCGTPFCKNVKIIERYVQQTKDLYTRQFDDWKQKNIALVINERNDMFDINTRETNTFQQGNEMFDVNTRNSNTFQQGNDSRTSSADEPSIMFSRMMEDSIVTKKLIDGGISDISDNNNISFNNSFQQDSKTIKSFNQQSVQQPISQSSLSNSHTPTFLQNNSLENMFYNSQKTFDNIAPIINNPTTKPLTYLSNDNDVHTELKQPKYEIITNLGNNVNPYSLMLTNAYYMILKNKNFVICTWSLFVSFFMLLFGAQGITENELKNILLLNQSAENK